MICPLCTGQMEEGSLESAEVISWNQPNKPAFPVDNEGIIWTQGSYQGFSTKENVKLPGASGWRALWGGSEVPAFLCRICRKIIISY